MYNNVLIFEEDNLGSEPVTLQEAKDWGKIETSTDDTIVTALIKAARRTCEKFTGIGFITRDITLHVDLTDNYFSLPYGPVTGGPSAVDTDGNVVDLVYNMGQIEDPLGRMVLSYTGGYATLPEDLEVALKCQFLYMYENRGEGSDGMSPIAKMILSPLRVVV